MNELVAVPGLPAASLAVTVIVWLPTVETVIADVYAVEAPPSST